MDLTHRHRTSLLLLLLLLLGLGVGAVGAQNDAFEALEDAYLQTGTADTFSYSFNIDFNASGIPDLGEDFTFTLFGDGRAAQNAIELGLYTALTGVSVEDAPLIAQLRLVDDMLYFTQDGRMWTGVDFNEFTTLAQGFAVNNFRSGFAGAGSTNNATMDATSAEALNSLVRAARFDVAQFQTTTLVDEDTGLPIAHYRTELDVNTLASSDEMMELVTALIQLGDAEMVANATAAELALVRTLLSELFQDTSVTLDSYVNLDTGYVDRALFNLDMSVSPETFNAPAGDNINIALTIDLTMFDFETTPAVVAPEGAMVMGNLAGLLGMEALPTEVAQLPTLVPTEAPNTDALRAIQANTPITVTLNGGPAEVLYQATAGETITVTARSLEQPGALDTTVELLSANGIRIDYNDDHGTDLPGLSLFDSALEDVVLPNAGMYTIRVSTFSGVGTGDVELTVLSGAAPVQQPTAVPTTAPVATGGSIVANTPTVVTLSGGFTDLTYAASAGEVVTITARSVERGVVDTTLELRAPNGGSIAVNDDHGSDLPGLATFDSALEDVRLDEAGLYTIRVDSFGGVGSGDVEVTVQSSSAPVQQATAVPTSSSVLQANVPTIASLTGDGPTELTYTAAAGETVTITVRSVAPGALDTTLELLAPDGSVYGFNDDHKSDLPDLDTYDSALRDLTLSQAGVYTIRVSAFGRTGDVLVTVQSSAAPQQPTAIANNTSPTVSLNTTVSLSASGPSEVPYAGTAGETITVTARSLEQAGTLDTTLEVLSPDGTRLAYNDDHGSSLPNLALFDSAVQDVVLPTTGMYTIRVSTFSGAGEGNVELTVQTSIGSTSQPTAVPNVTPTPVDVRLTGETDTVRGEVPAGSSFTYNFNGRPNQVTTITVQAGATGDLDPRVALIGPDGTVLAENDDHADNDPALNTFDSRISNFVLPVEGNYSVVVTGFANSSGAFTLTMQRAVEGGESIVTPVAPDTPVIVGEETVITGRLRDGETYTYELNGNAGDVYTIVVRGLDDLDPRVIVSDPDGFVVAENDDHTSMDPTLGFLDSKIETLILQETGTYSIEITDYSGDRGSFELGITLVMTDAPTGPGEDQVLLGQINQGGTYTTTVDLNAGSFVTITVRTVSGDLDPIVSLIDASGNVIAENDDHEDFDTTLANYDSRIPRMLITEGGTYTIEVRGFSGSGTVTVTVNTIG